MFKNKSIWFMLQIDLDSQSEKVDGSFKNWLSYLSELLDLDLCIDLLSHRKRSVPR